MIRLKLEVDDHMEERYFYTSCMYEYHEAREGPSSRENKNSTLQMLKRKFWQLVFKLSKKLFYIVKTSCFCDVLPSNHISGKGFNSVVNLKYPKIRNNYADLVLIFSRFWYICDPKMLIEF